MAKKVILKDENLIEVMPITRGELILDSSGNPAFHSNEFLATDSQPGLMSAEDKYKIINMQASSVANALTLKINNGSVEGTNLYTYNGSVAKTLNIIAGDNITLTPTDGVLSISANIPTINDVYTKTESDNRYLQLSGGTLILEDRGSFSVKRNKGTGYGAYIQYENSEEILGHLGLYKRSDNVYLADVYFGDGSNYQLIHSGNIGDGLLINDSGLSVDTGVSNGKIVRYASFPEDTTLINEGFLESTYAENGYPTDWFLKALCKWAMKTYKGNGRIVLIGSAFPNISGTCILHIYSSSLSDDSWLPQYCSGLFETLGGDIVTFGTYNYNWFYDSLAKHSNIPTSLPANGGNADTSTRTRYIETKYDGSDLWFGDSYKAYIQWEGDTARLKVDGYNTSVNYANNAGDADTSDATSRFKLECEAWSSNKDMNTALFGGGMMRNYTSYSSSIFQNVPTNMEYGCVVQFSAYGKDITRDDLSGQFAWDTKHHGSDSTGKLWWRCNDDRNFSHAKWHQIAFTDSTVAAADKLATPRSIWGQSFDGSGDVSGRLQIQDSWGIKVTDNNAENYGYFCTAGYIGDVTDGREMQLTGRHGLIVSSYGNYIYLQEAGNVGIGTTDPQYKLDVNGNLRANGNVLLEAAAGGVSGGGIAFWNSSGWTNGTINASKLVINNASNGRVGIGTTEPRYTLDVNGSLSSTILNTMSIELNSDGRLQGYGGFIDFHFNGASDDYTARIIEIEKGTITIGPRLKVEESVVINGHTSLHAGNFKNYFSDGFSPKSDETLAISTSYIAESLKGDGLVLDESGKMSVDSSKVVTIADNQTISGHKIFLPNKFTLTGVEHNDIKHSTQKEFNWGGFNEGATPAWSGMYNTLDFQWYGHAWSIGNIRSGSDASEGFGIGKKTINSEGKIYFQPSLRVTETETYINNNKAIHSGNIADYVVNVTNYVTLDSVQIISGVKTFSGANIPIKLNSTGNEVGIQFLLNGTAKGWVGHTNTTGTYIYNYPSAKYIGVKDDGTPYYYSGGFNTLLHSGNCTDYTVTKTGIGASGTWGISITGSSYYSDLSNFIYSHDTRYDTINPNTYNNGVRCHFLANGTNGVSDGDSYYGLLHIKHYGGKDDHTGGYPHQIAFTPNNNLWHRIGTSATTWGSWIKILDSNNYSSTLDSRYLINHGMSNSRPNGGTFTLPGGTNGVSMRSKATGGNDIGIFQLTDDNAFICNSSDNCYLFATFDTDKTNVFNDAANAAFAVLSDHAGVSMKGDLSVSGCMKSQTVYANRDGSSTGGGVSLYADTDPMTYGIAFRGTSTYGTHGSVTSDWATYFTMNNQTDRGWIFRRYDTNICSISGGGIITTEGSVRAKGFVHHSYWSSAYALTSDGGVAHIGSMSVNYASSSGNADTVDGYHISVVTSLPSTKVNNTIYILV